MSKTPPSEPECLSYLQTSDDWLTSTCPSPYTRHSQSIHRSFPDDSYAIHPSFPCHTPVIPVKTGIYTRDA